MGKIKALLKSRSKIKDIILLFLLGFFCGGIVYFLFQKSYVSSLEQLEGGLVAWSGVSHPLWENLLFVFFEHCKGYALMWLLSYARIAIPYAVVFTVYRGFGYGFVCSSFLGTEGATGAVFFLKSIFPQALFLAPMYLFMIRFIYEGKREKQVTAILISAALLIIGCVMEAYFNIPIVQSLYK